MNIQHIDSGSPEMMDMIQQRLREEEKLLEELRFVMSSALAKAGLCDALTIIPQTFSGCDLEVDKYDGSSSLLLAWQSKQGQKQGLVNVNAIANS